MIVFELVIITYIIRVALILVSYTWFCQPGDNNLLGMSKLNSKTIKYNYLHFKNYSLKCTKTIFNELWEWILNLSPIIN